MDHLDADKLRKLLPGMIENQLLELSDNIYKMFLMFLKGKDTIEKALPKISETETSVINETQITPGKAVDNKVIAEKMVNSIERPTISKNDVESLPHDIEKNIKRNRAPLY